MNQDNTKFILENLGFGQDFFHMVCQEVYLIKKSSMRKNFSESAVVKIQGEENEGNSYKKRSKEEEDVELYREAEDNSDFHVERNNPKSEFGDSVYHRVTNLFGQNGENAKSKSMPPENQLAFFQSCSSDQMKKLDELIENMNNSTKEKRHIIRAHKSKHKTKFFSLYEKNSQHVQEKIKDKIFHMCNYPGCCRTFASSGWLRSHFSEHLKEMKRNKFNLLFDYFMEIQGKTQEASYQYPCESTF